MANDDIRDAIVAAAAALGAGLGRMLTFDPKTQDYKQAAVGGYTLGAKYFFGADEYRYCKQGDAIAPVVGGAAFHDDSGVFGQVTNDYSESLGDVLIGAGCYVNIPAQNDHFFLLTKGRHSTLKMNADDDVIAGDEIIITAVDNGLHNKGARTIGTGAGVSLAADVDAADTCDVRVNYEANW